MPPGSAARKGWRPASGAAPDDARRTVPLLGTAAGLRCGRSPNPARSSRSTSTARWRRSSRTPPAPSSPRRSGALLTLDRAAPVVVITGRGRADAQRRLGFRPATSWATTAPRGSREGACGASIRADRKTLGAAAGCAASGPRRPGRGPRRQGRHALLALPQGRGPRVRAPAILRAAARLSPRPGGSTASTSRTSCPGRARQGGALALLVRHLGCRRAFYIGDDETDEDVFASAGPRSRVRVGRKPRARRAAGCGTRARSCRCWTSCSLCSAGGRRVPDTRRERCASPDPG